MSRKRDYIRKDEKLAAALACLLPQEQGDDLRARKVSAAEVIARFEIHHIIFHAIGGTDAWWNLDPKIRAIHREKSRRDTSIVAKVRRLVATNSPATGLRSPPISLTPSGLVHAADAQNALSGRPKRKIQQRSSWPIKGARKFSKPPKRKMQSRPFGR